MINQYNVTNRIAWIDIAKLIGMVSVIISHTVPYGSDIRNLMFSFHMPLFFILTGYTMKPVTSLNNLRNSVKKDFKYLIIPCILFQTINLLLRIIINKNSIRHEIFYFLEELFWASAIKIQDFPALGALWFLVVLFWSKLLFRTINLIFQSNYSFIVVLLSIIFGKILLNHNIFLPQSLDIAFIAIVFLLIGRLLKEYNDLLEVGHTFSILISFIIWVFLWQNDIYINMGSRRYPQFVLCIVGAVCASYIIILFAKLIEESINGILKDGCCLLGRETLILLGIHHLDSWLPFLWHDSNIKIMMMKRIFLDLILAFIIIFLYTAIKKLLFRKS